MPYLRWLETSRTHAERPAVFTPDGVVNFAQLAARVDRMPCATGPQVARSGDIGFFVEILRAWRDGVPVIPIEKEAPEPLIASSPPDSTRLIKCTPGASGVPRGIFFDGAQIIADGDRLVDAMGLSPDVPNLAVISLAHSYGFSNIVLPLLLHGVPVHLAPVPFPRAVEEILARHGPMVVPAVPSIWRAWHRSGILESAPVALAVSAGAPLSSELESAVFAASGLKIHNFYGASECGGISYDASEEPRISSDDMGSPLPGVRVELGKDGRFQVASSGVAMGYDSLRTDDVLGDGIYLTRDMGHLDAEGRIHLRETLGGAINVSGRKVSPTKVRGALMATGLVRSASVRGIPSPDPERFAEIVAEVELHQGASLNGLKSAAAALLQGWEMPRHWTLLDPGAPQAS